MTHSPSSLRRALFKGNGLNFALAMGAHIASMGLSLTIAWILQQLTDAIMGGSGTSMPRLGLYTLGMVAAEVAVTALDCLVSPRFKARALEQYKQTAFARLMEKGMAAFYKEGTASYLSALSNDITALSTGYLSNLFLIVSLSLSFVGAFVIMLLYSPLLTAIAVGCSLLPLLSAIFTGDKMEAAEKGLSDANASYMETLKDCLSGFSVIKSFKAEKQLLQQYAKCSKETEAARCRRLRLSLILNGIGMLTGVLAQFGVFFAAAWLALTDSAITPGIAIAFVQLMNYVINPIAQLPSVIGEIRSSGALIKKLETALSENVPDAGEDIPHTLHEGIALENVTFGYEENTPVLQDISVTFEAGKSYALVGASGCGKSTLLNLLMGANGGYTGRIAYDGKELKQVSTASLYELVSQIQQNVFIFNGTIRDNITLYKDFPQEEVDRAIALSGLTALLEEKGEDYPCGENGCGLSGGEKQRISIARCLLRRSGVLLADEATAALDAQTAHLVSDAILNLRGLTRIIVTHGLEASLLSRYDCILTIKNGRICEQGTFDGLMEQKGYFYSLYTVAQ